MNFYYCQSKWEHAVIEAKNVPLAKDTFVEIINSNLEDNKKISASDVKAVIVNVYHKGSKTAEQSLHLTAFGVDWAALDAKDITVKTLFRREIGGR